MLSEMEMCAHEYELTDPDLYTKSVPLKIHQIFEKFNGINMENNKGNRKHGIELLLEIYYRI